MLHFRVTEGLRPVGRATTPGVAVHRDVDLRTAVVRKQRPRPDVVAAPPDRVFRAAVAGITRPDVTRETVGPQPRIRCHLPPRQPLIAVAAVALIKLAGNMNRGPILSEILVKKLRQPDRVAVFQHSFPKTAGVGTLPIPPAAIPKPSVTGTNTNVSCAKRLAGLFDRRGAFRRRPRLNRLNRPQVAAQQTSLLSLQPDAAVDIKLPQRGHDLFQYRGQPGLIQFAPDDVPRERHCCRVALGLHRQNSRVRQHAGTQRKAFPDLGNRRHGRQRLQRRHLVCGVGPTEAKRLPLVIHIKDQGGGANQGMRQHQADEGCQCSQDGVGIIDNTRG